MEQVAGLGFRAYGISVRCEEHEPTVQLGFQGKLLRASSFQTAHDLGCGVGPAASGKVFESDTGANQRFNHAPFIRGSHPM